MSIKSKSSQAQEKQQTTKSAESKTTTDQQQMSLEMLISQAAFDSKSLTPADASQLQRSIGNQAVNQLVNRANFRPTNHTPLTAISLQRLLTNRGIQAKLTVNTPGDPYEQEADTVAKQVVTAINTHDVQKPTIQRQEDDEQIMTKPMIQRVENGSGGTVNDTVERDIQQARGHGQPLADHVRSSMEQAFGTDFSGVKIHTDSKSNHLNHAVQAKAFTTGQDVFFRHGEFNPGSKSGQELLAHELTHVVQQKPDRVKPAVQRKRLLAAKNVFESANAPGERKENKSPSLPENERQQERTFLQRRFAPISQHHAATTIVQTKRNILDEQTQKDFAANSRGDDAKKTDTPQVAAQNYNLSLDSGRRLLTKGLKWFTDAHDKEPSISTLGGTFDNVIKAKYKVFWFFPDEESVTICMTRGEEFDDLENGEVDGYSFGPFDDDQDFLYANTFNVKTGEFHASINYKNAHDKVAEEEGLPPALSNSEIIWFQQAHAKDAYRDKHPDAGQLSNITSISREQIGNTRTLDTIFMVDDTREAFKDGEVTLDEPTEEAIALLGTPNGNSAVWILIQHAASGSVDIQSVKFTKNGLVISYLF